MKAKQKKGIMLSESFGAVLAVVLIGVLVIVAIFLFSSLTATFVNQATARFDNQTHTVNATTVAVMNNITACNRGTVALVLATNATGGETIIAGNYTFNGNGSIIATAGAADYIGESWNITYTFPHGGASCNAGTNLITQFATYPALVGLVGTIVFLGLVIGVLVTSFVFGRKEQL